MIMHTAHRRGDWHFSGYQGVRNAKKRTTLEMFLYILEHRKTGDSLGPFLRSGSLSGGDEARLTGLEAFHTIGCTHNKTLLLFRVFLWRLRMSSLFSLNFSGSHARFNIDGGMNQVCRRNFLVGQRFLESKHIYRFHGAALVQTEKTVTHINTRIIYRAWIVCPVHKDILKRA